MESCMNKHSLEEMLAFDILYSLRGSAELTSVSLSDSIIPQYFIQSFPMSMVNTA